MNNPEFYFTAEDRNRFRAGDLARGWAERFPQLFSEADLRVALNQPQYHFYKWLAAVRLFTDHGYISIADSYHWKSHPEPYRKFRELASPETVKLMTLGDGSKPRTQGPDLLTFLPDGTEWFFVEVKGPRDTVSPAQTVLFQRLERLSGRPVHVAQCWEGRPAGA